ncbi:class III signal peptide-containing protein [bacterium]|nr:class III signal peptide-containing protein [bacterium]
MKNKLLKRLKERKGQTSVEYILIIVVIVGAVFLFGDRLKEGLKTATDTLFGQINSAIGEKIP